MRPVIFDQGDDRPAPLHFVRQTEGAGRFAGDWLAQLEHDQGNGSATIALTQRFFRRRNSMTQRPMIVRLSLIRCVIWVELTEAGFSVGSSKSRTGLISGAVEPASDCLTAAIVARRCVAVALIASRFS